MTWQQKPIIWSFTCQIGAEFKRILYHYVSPAYSDGTGMPKFRVTYVRSFNNIWLDDYYIHITLSPHSGKIESIKSWNRPIPEFKQIKIIRNQAAEKALEYSSKYLEEKGVVPVDIKCLNVTLIASSFAYRTHDEDEELFAYQKMALYYRCYYIATIKDCNPKYKSGEESKMLIMIHINANSGRPVKMVYLEEIKIPETQMMTEINSGRELNVIHVL